MKETPEEDVVNEIEEPEPPPKIPHFVKPRRGDSINILKRNNRILCIDLRNL